MSVIGTKIATTLIAEAARRVGTPLLKKFLTKKFGDKAGNIGGKIADSLTDAVTKRVESTAGPLQQGQVIPSQEIEAAVKYVEDNEAADIIELELQSQQEANRLMIAEMNKGHWITWFWRPGMMYLLGFLWFWAIFGSPVTNAIIEDDMPAIDTSTLLGVTSLYLALYMGGHTVKKVFGGK
jgi:hypothetical protein